MTTKDDVAATGKPEEKAKPRRLTPKQWAVAEAMWENGEATLDDLAKRFGISNPGIHNHMKRAGIRRGAKAEAHKRKVAEAVTKAAVDDATVIAARIRETKEEHYKMAAGLAKLAWSEILKAKQDNLPVAVAMGNLKALDAAMTVMTKARSERWAVLGLDRSDYVDEDALPELLISELTADQIDELRNRKFGDLEELPDDGISLDDTDAEDDTEDDDGVVDEG
jgi:hypothetical protein